MEATSVMVTGSLIRNEIFRIRHDITDSRTKPLKNLDGQTCYICGDKVGVTSSGAIFVACDECAFPVCRPCYEYERKDGNQYCPQCKTRYKRHKGSRRVEGDEEEDDFDDLENEFNFARGTSMAKHQWQADYLHFSSSFKHEMQLLPLLTNGQMSSGEFLSATPDSQSVRSTSGPIDPEKLGNYSLTYIDPCQPVPVRIVDPSKDLMSYGLGSVDWKERIANWKFNSNKDLEEKGGDIEDSGSNYEELQMVDNMCQPMSLIVPIPSSHLTAYRVIIILRLIILAFFLQYRVTHPVKDAYPLWLTSVICEIWFAMSWILDQFPKWYPINRVTYLDRLKFRYDREEEQSQLAPIDVFVSTVDPLKEPPIITANTVLSILAVDYPVDKVSCYVSDDGSTMLTFEALVETAEFAKLWVPFCKEFNIEPRAPEFYFSKKIDYLKDKVHPSFVKRRRSMKRQYEEFKVRMNALVAKAQKAPEEGWLMRDGMPWPGNNPRDHPAMIQVFLGDSGEQDMHGNILPRLVYVSREKRPGFQHHKKAGAMNALIRVSAILTNGAYLLNVDCDHYFNNSKCLREAMCFLMDPALRMKVCYVQFPQRFDGIDLHDRYANRNIVFFDINMKGQDGIQGPVYVGTGCCFNRQALYGYDPVLTADDLEPDFIIKNFFESRNKGTRDNKKNMEKKKSHQKSESSIPMINMDDNEEVIEDDDDDEEFLIMTEERLEKRFGQSPVFIAATFMDRGGVPTAANPATLLKESIHVLSCGYEDKTEWGKEIGWIYGSVTEDILTGFKMHARGWQSIYCIPLRPAFKGSAPLNLSDRLNQVLRWALGSIEILFSRHCPVWYGYKGRLRFLQRLAYINTVAYPLTSIPLLAYCILPAVCLLTNKFIIPTLSNADGILFILLFISIAATGIIELRWSGVSTEDWWRNEQFWVIGGTSAHLFAVFQGLLKVIAGIDTNFTVTSKASDDDDGFSELYMFKWTSLLIPPTTVLIVNMVGVVAGSSNAINAGYQSWGPLFGKLLFSFWVIAHLYPFLKGLLGRQSRIPTIVIVWSVLLASIFSLLWVRISPFTSTAEKFAATNQCGLDC